jgi:ABC-type Zn uptake system ZnuABC Zn-binding protein ZnuA
VHMEEVMKKILCAAALLLAMSLGACTQDTEDNPNDGSGKAPYQAVATVGMVGDIVENVAGEKVSVQRDAKAPKQHIRSQHTDCLT